jgi:hypothetical protein
MATHETPGFTAPGEEKLAGLEPYWWSIICFVVLIVVVLIMTQVVY